LKKEKSKDFNRILKEYSELQIRFEKQKLKAITIYLNKLKNISTKGEVEEQSDLNNIAEFHGITVVMTRIKSNLQKNQFLQQQQQKRYKQQQHYNNNVRPVQYDERDFNIDQKESPKIFQQYDPLNVAPI